MKKLLLTLGIASVAFSGFSFERILYSENYETATDVSETGWTTPNGSLSLYSGEDGKCINLYQGGGSGSRSFSVTWGDNIYKDSNGNSLLEDSEYYMSFDFCYTAFSNNKYDGCLDVFTNHAQKENNQAYRMPWRSDGKGGVWENFLFDMTQDNDNKSPNKFFVNAPTQKTENEDNTVSYSIPAENPFTLTKDNWYSVTLTVNINDRTVKYTVQNLENGKESDNISGTRTVPEINPDGSEISMLAQGMYTLAGRADTNIRIDNIKIYCESEDAVANEPSISLSRVGINSEGTVNTSLRAYNIIFMEGETLHVIGTDDSTKDVTYTECNGCYVYETTTTGTLTAWTTIGKAKSEEVTEEVNCEPIPLPEAVVSIVAITEGYGKTYTFSASNADVPLKPEITFSYVFNGKSDKIEGKGSTITVTEEGTLSVTTEAAGYQPTTISVDNNGFYALKKKWDFARMSDEEITVAGFPKYETQNLGSGGGFNTWTSGRRLYYKNSGKSVYPFGYVSDDSSNVLYLSTISSDINVVGKELFPGITVYAGHNVRYMKHIGMVNDETSGGNYKNVDVLDLDEKDLVVINTIGGYGNNSNHPECSSDEEYYAQLTGEDTFYKASDGVYNSETGKYTVSCPVYRIDTAATSVTVYSEVDLNADYTYTLLYVNEDDGNTIKEVEGTGKFGDSITLTEEETAEFEFNGTKYFVISNDAAGKTVTLEGTIVTLKCSSEPKDPNAEIRWDFTNWSEATVNNLKVGSNWSDIEKADATEPSETSKDNCFWQVDLSADLSSDKYLMANNEVIKELKGLVYVNTTNPRNLAIAVNYPEALSKYKGGSYLWLGGGAADYFIIPNVPAGATIKMGVESHKATDARGVELSISGTKLNAPDGSSVEIPTKYADQEWFVPTTVAESNSVLIRNTNGCHIYYITITPPVKVTEIVINDKDKNQIDNLTLKKGVAYQLSATISPADATNKSVTWKSSDESIVTVDQTGKVTTVEEGEANITATAANGIVATCKITVDGVIEVKTITLEKSEETLNTGETLQLNATVDPSEAAITWSSDNNEIATVDANGNVTAIAEGKASITATAGDKTATCTITVTVPVDGITLNFEKLTVETGDEFTVGYTISPDNATDKTVTWTSSSEEVATVDESGNVKVLAAGEAVITAKAGSKEASCTITVVAPEETDGARVRMTYVDMNNPTTPIGIIQKGESSRSGFNAISNGSVGFGNTGWGENKITYIQVDASAIKDNYITSATLTFEASGSTDSKRQTKWGVGYNSSIWSSAMTYDSADKSITTLGDTQTTSTKASGTFETFSFDITEAINETDGRIATILVYETEAAGGYIKNPVVEIVSTNELVYKVTFTETVGAEGVKVTVNEQDATNGMSLPNGTYSFTATAPHYKDFSGEFTVADEDLNVEFEMTQKDKWNYTVKNNVNTEVIEGSVFEGENATVSYNRYILKDGTVYMKAPCGGDKKLEYNYTFTPDGNNHEETLEYSVQATDGIYFIEAEDIDGMTSTTDGNAGVRASNSLGAYPTPSEDTEASAIEVTKLLPGKYKVEIAFSGGRNTDTDPTFFVKAGENTVLKGTTNGSWNNPISEEFTLDAETILTIEGGSSSKPLDYILITGTVAVPATGITLDKKEIVIVVGATETIVATVEPENTTDVISWSSSNEEVATVDQDGKVTAVDAGEATIKVTAGKQSATCKVIVKNAVTDVNISKTEATLTKGETLTLTATLVPEDAIETEITWSSSKDVATVDEDGTVTAVGVGKTTITATCGDFSATCDVKVYPRVGDADWSGKITINDAVDITNYVVKRKTVKEGWTKADWEEFYLVGANANKDEEGEVTFADAREAAVLALKEPVTEPEESTQTRIRAYEDDSMDALVIGRASASTDGTILPVALDNSMAYVALQADIILPEGMNVDVKAGSRIAGSHSLMTRKHADNHIRVVIFNLSNSAFVNNDAPILEIITDSYISASDIMITTVLASDADAKEYVLAAKTSVSTGVAALGLDENAPIKVFDVNGIYVSDTMEDLQQGTYIVRQGDEAKKVRIR